MKHFKFTMACLLAIFQITLLQSQTQKGQLVKNKTITSSMGNGEKHRYKVHLDKNQFATFQLMQKGIDVFITTYDPNGMKLDDFDSPNGKEGAENVIITSTIKGEYVLEIYPVDDKQSIGSYDLQILQIKPKATKSNDRVDELFAIWDTPSTPGASVAVIKNGSIIYKKGYGMSNLEYDIKNDPTTVFHVASISKQFTVFSILLLQKEGKLSLDDDIRKYIPEVPDFGKTITLRHLATHTSGLRDQWSLVSMAGWQADDLITTEQILKMVSKQKELNFNPGDELVYCNTGFTLLAEVVARVSGKTFAQFTEENIFKPLKMSHTLFYDNHEKIVKNRAYSYSTDEGGYKKLILNYETVGATSLFTTAEDLSLWAMNFEALKVGDSTIIETMNTPTALSNGHRPGGAMGQFIGQYKGLNEIQHGGADAGFRSFLTRFPDEHFAVVVLSNTAEFNSGSIAHKIVDIYLADKIKEEKKEEVQPKTMEESGSEIAIDKQVLESYVGNYELNQGFILNVSHTEGKLFVQPTLQPQFALRALTTAEFKIDNVDATMTFVPDAEGRINSITFKQGGNVMNAPRVKAFDASTVNLKDFTGNYYSEELSTQYALVLKEGKLFAQHYRLRDFEFTPFKEGFFDNQFGVVEFVRDTNGIIAGFKQSSDRVKNLLFRKI
ncbi:CubicO group peptidase (beta-lactamase class C family) [Flavobacterium arsenatis]|uniref:CubicO group peptidase (Beta-lactamase class C family) n=1 Tax=Flavobacterium arsenatis TaxID=1484332 RepID=A0ABU1TQY0_9FLAO|nr:serine hydrolase [Flavobacterium arsenatis]MDR6967777.1 CubicO group peptidase (beta-lactamase class C family) [Flavobacterium arsenatis]